MFTGGFDPLHPGHLECIEAGAAMGTVVVGLNSDAWLVCKKGHAFMPWRDRATLLAHIRGVDSVVPFDDADGTAADAIRTVRPRYFLNGGDRRDATELPEAELAVCREAGAEPMFIQGTKTRASSRYLAAAMAAAGRLPGVWRSKPWGAHAVLQDDTDIGYKVKLLRFNPGCRTSLQRHQHREEFLVLVQGYAAVSLGEPQGIAMVPGRAVEVRKLCWHRIVAGPHGALIVETQYGAVCSEDDIERAQEQT